MWLEEIADSDLLVHVVDASNPRAIHQIESVDKILADLKLNKIPQVVVLNKADLLNVDDIEVLRRQILLDKDVSVVSISANVRETLRPLVEQVAVRIGKFAVSETAG